MWVLLLFVFVICLLIGVPIAFSMGILGMGWSLLSGGEWTLVVRRMYYGADSFTLLAVPLFMLAAMLMNSGDLARQLINFCRVVFGRFRGGLAYMNVLDSMIFAGMSGSSQADAAGLGGIIMPEMQKAGYHPGVTAGITAASATIGVIIPPSIPMLVMGATVSISISGMFMGGVIPGIVIGLMQIAQVFYMARKHNFPRAERLGLRESVQITLEALPALVVPLIVLGGTGAGIFTATEAGVVSAFYALIVSLITGQLSLKSLWKVLKEVAIMSSLPLLICSVGAPLGWILAFQGIPEVIGNAITSFTQSPTVVLTIVALIVLFLGCFVDNIVIITIMAPILLPISNAVGIDPIHFAIVFVVSSAIGLITPPVGQVLFVTSTVARVSFETVTKGTIPFLIGEIAVLGLLIVIPGFSTWLPRLILG